MKLINNGCKIAAFALLSLSALLFYSCTHEDELETQKDAVVVSEDPNFVSVEQALAALRTFDAPGAETRAADREVANVEVLNRSALIPATRSAVAEDLPLGYVVNFTEGGYAVLGADARQGGVIALVEAGSLSAQALVEAKRALDAREVAIGIETYVNGMVAAELVGGLTREATSVADTAPDTRANPGGWVPVDLNPPLLKTEWTQWAPYNQFYYSITRNDYPVGCVAQALTQVLIYNEDAHGAGPSLIDNSKVGGFDSPITPPYYPNWSVLIEAIKTPTPAVRYQAEVSRMLYEVGKTVGVKYNSASSVTDIERAADYLQTVSGYKNIAVRPVTLANIKEMIDKELPVIVKGCGRDDFNYNDFSILDNSEHVWVIDGYKQEAQQFLGTVNGVPTIITHTYDYVHARFGYGNTLNGWYQFTDTSWVCNTYSVLEMINYAMTFGVIWV